MGKTPKPEEIVGKLREAEIVLAQCRTISDACRRISVAEQKRSCHGINCTLLHPCR